MITVSTSSIRDWHRCSRYYQHKHVDRVVPVVEPKHLRIGTLVHKGLEAWFTAAWWGQRNGRLRAALAAVEHEPDAIELARVRAMLIGYHCVWSAEPMRVIAVERSFERHVSDLFHYGVMFNGRVDALIEREHGLYVVEHKTTSSDIGAGSMYWDQRRMDPQISNYIDTTGAHGLIYDVLRKPGHKPKDGEAPDEFERRVLAAIVDTPDTYYVRRLIVRLDDERRSAQEDLYCSALQIAKARQLQMYPRNPYACLSYGQRCEYLDVCMGVTTLDNSRFMRRPT